MKSMQMIMMLVCAALSLGTARAVKDSFVPENCCPWSPECRCPQNQPPVFEHPWQCINGAFKLINRAYSDQTRKYDEGEMYDASFYFEDDFVPSITMHCDDFGQTIRLYVLILCASASIIILFCCIVFCKCKAEEATNNVEEELALMPC